MRLTCPNCGAQYEVPDDVIPTEGRDVQCSACGTTWFHPHPDHPSAEPDTPDASPVDMPQDDPSDAAEPDAEEPDEDADITPFATPPRRELDPEVAEILRAEAKREATLRAAERDPGAAASPEPTDAPAPETTPDPEPVGGHNGQADEAASASAPPPPPERDLPNQKQIAATLHSASEPQGTAEASDKATPRRGGFMRGFTLVILLVAALLLIYSNAASISETVPSVAPLLDSYVDLVNQGRVWLDATINPPAPDQDN